MKKLTVLLLAIVAILLLFSSCASPDSGSGKSEITTPRANLSIGVNPDNVADQHLSYTIMLQNNGVTDVIVHSVEPVLLEAFAAKTNDKDLKVTVDKTVAPKAYIEVSGQIQFDATGMTKEQIVAMQPFFNDIKINTDKVLSIYGPSTK
jgi:hypothetical protein